MIRFFLNNNINTNQANCSSTIMTRNISVLKYTPILLLALSTNLYAFPPTRLDGFLKSKKTSFCSYSTSTSTSFPTSSSLFVQPEILDIEKPANDINTKYHQFYLSNGIPTTLVQDISSEKSSCSLGMWCCTSICMYLCLFVLYIFVYEYVLDISVS